VLLGPATMHLYDSLWEPLVVTVAGLILLLASF
jgi:hypothetical protein